MTRIQTIVTDFRRLREAAMVPATSFIIESMTDNAAYPEPPVKTTVLQTLLNSYSTALAEATSRDRNKIAVKNQLRKQLNVALAQNGRYVNMMADGDVPMLVSSGYTLAKQPEPRYIVSPKAPVIKQGINSGSLICKVEADKAATGYIHMRTAAPVTENSEWISVNTTRSQYEFTDLQAGKEYAFKVVVIGSKDQIAYSPITIKIAL